MSSRLADELAALASTAPKELDPTNEEFGDTRLLTEDDFRHEGLDDEDVDDWAVERPSKLRQKNRGNEMELSFQTGKYTGTPATRKQLGLDMQDEQQDETFEVDLDQDSSSDEDEDDSGSDSGSDSDDEDDGAMMIGAAPGGLASKLQELKKQETHALTNLVSSSRNDGQKAVHTRTQAKLYEQMVELRVKMQPLNLIATRLPPPETYDLFKNHSKELEQGFERVAQVALDLADDLAELKYVLARQNKHTGVQERTEKSVGKRKTKKTVWKKISQLDQDISPFINDSVEKWNARTQLSNKLSNKSFKAINQSILDQVEHTMSDRKRILERSQLYRGQQRMLGIKQKREEPEEEGSETLGTRKKRKQRGRTFHQHPEVFDDTDFYQQLLQEMLETTVKSSSDPVEMGRQWLAAKQLNSTVNRKIYNKKSKGRTLSYRVHDKLENFMFPVNDEHLSGLDPQFCRELFENGMFGGRNRVADEEGSGSDSE